MHTFYSAKRGDFYAAHTSSPLVKRLFGASANPQSFRAFLAPPKNPKTNQLWLHTSNFDQNIQAKLNLKFDRHWDQT